jgi:hypothetical protein
MADAIIYKGVTAPVSYGSRTNRAPVLCGPPRGAGPSP